MERETVRVSRFRSGVMPHTNKDSAGRVWAIVLMYGGERVTAECIGSLLRQDYGDLTVLLVDNASPDGAGDRLRARFPQIRYVQTGANLGYTGGNNRGIQIAIDQGADFLLVVNNDTVLDPGCVALLVDAARRGTSVGAVAPKILYFDDPARIAFAGGDHSTLRALGKHRRAAERDDPKEPPRVEEITFVTGSCFLMPSPVARELGGFREDFFMYCEDVELSLRARRAGYRLYYQPAARVLHREPARRELSAPNASFHRDRNRRRLVRAYYTPLQRLVFAAWFYPTRIIRVAQYLARGDWDGARAIVAGVLAR